MGFDHILFAPPADLLAQTVAGASGGNTSSPPLTWASATRQSTKGSIELTYRLEVGGKGSTGFSGLYMHVAAPANTVATTMIPLLGWGTSSRNSTLTEGGHPVWDHGKFVGTAIPGIKTVFLSRQKDALVVEHFSGSYDFMLS